MTLFSPLAISWRFAGDLNVPAGRWGSPRPLSRSHCSWGTSSSCRVTIFASEMPHRLPWHGRSQGGLGFGRCSAAGSPEPRFSWWLTGAGRSGEETGLRASSGCTGKGLECHKALGAMGLGLGTEGYGDAVARAGLSALWGSDPLLTPMSAPRQLCGCSAVPKMHPSSL